MISSVLQRLFLIKHLYYRSAIIASLLLSGLVICIWRQPFVPVEYITRDPAAIAIHPIYYGALSNLGVLLWGSSVTSCLLGALVTKLLSDRWEIVAFFAAFGGLNAMLCLDDLFMIHEEVLPRKLGIPEEALFICYAIALTAMLVRFRRVLLKTQPVLFGASLILFAFSLSIDLMPALASLSRNSLFAIEDGSKFVAIFVWSAYFLWAAVEKITLQASSLALRSADQAEPISVQALTSSSC